MKVTMKNGEEYTISKETEYALIGMFYSLAKKPKNQWSAEVTVYEGCHKFLVTFSNYRGICMGFVYNADYGEPDAETEYLTYCYRHEQKMRKGADQQEHLVRAVCNKIAQALSMDAVF